MPLSHLALCISLCVALLAGCQRHTTDSPHATSLEPAALMQAAVPGWTDSGPGAVREIEQASGLYALNPLMVVPLADQRVVLIVTGTPSNASGEDMSGHASPGLLGAYWFEQRDGKWWPAGAQPYVAELGFFGNVGDVRVIPRGAGQQALAVENGSCWQGMCGKWLSLFDIGLRSITPMLAKDDSITLESSAVDATASCQALVQANAGSTHHVSTDDYSTNYGCFDVTSHWRIQPQAKADGDLVIDFSGAQTRAELVPLAQAAASPQTAASAPKSPPPGDDTDPPTEEYVVTVLPVRETVVYRMKNGIYQLHSGTNPAPSF